MVAEKPVRRLVAPVVGVWLTTAVWAAVTLGSWVYLERDLETGAEIALRALPIDPRDVLRGDYVVLRYEISTAERDREGRPFVDDQTVFVSLVEAGDGDWRVGELHREPPDGGLYLRGRIHSVGPSRYGIRYGIESFFVPEGEGRQYEEARNRDRLWAVVSVSPHGVAYLKRLENR